VITVLLFTGLNSQAAELINFSIKGHHYQSYRLFAKSVCLPCHYRAVPHGTDLETPMEDMSEGELRDYLQPLLRSGNMPPNKAFREIATMRFNLIKKR
jgi:hypothetical protein